MNTNIEHEKIRTIKLLLDSFKAPFEYNETHALILDSNNILVLDILGYERFQHVDEATEIQNGMGQLIAHLLNKEFSVFEKFINNISNDKDNSQ